MYGMNKRLSEGEGVHREWNVPFLLQFFRFIVAATQKEVPSMPSTCHCTEGGPPCAVRTSISESRPTRCSYHEHCTVLVASSTANH